MWLCVGEGGTGEGLGRGSEGWWRWREPGWLDSLCRPWLDLTGVGGPRGAQLQRRACVDKSTDLSSLSLSLSRTPQNVVPNAHFNKQWQNRVSVNFAQPMKKKRRRMARKAKAAKVAPRPAELLRPVVSCSSQRYNMRVKYGRGFSFDELRAVGLKPKLAQTIGIAVDHRRTNKSVDSLERNVARLKEYMSKLVLFPQK